MAAKHGKGNAPGTEAQQEQEQAEREKAELEALRRKLLKQGKIKS